MSQLQGDPKTGSRDLTLLQQLVQAEQGKDIEGFNIIVKHVHQHQSSGLLEAALALLVALLFVFGSVFLAIAAINFYQGSQVNQNIHHR